VKRVWYLALLSLLVAALLVSPSIGCQFFGGEDDLTLWDVGPITLDPAISADMSSHTYVMQIFSGLVRLDHELNIVPDIAESWEKSPDGKTYTFYLRQGVKFHSGREALVLAQLLRIWAISLAPKICWWERWENSPGL